MAGDMLAGVALLKSRARWNECFEINLRAAWRPVTMRFHFRGKISRKVKHYTFLNRPRDGSGCNFPQLQSVKKSRAIKCVTLSIIARE